MGSQQSQPEPVEAKPVEDDKHPDNVKAEHEGWKSLADKPRGCTDCLCLLIILACWFAMTILGFIAIGLIDNPNLPHGNPRKLMNPVDFNGEVCGYGSLKHKKYGYYLLDKSVVCVSSCPESNDYNSVICRYEDQQAADASIVVAAEKVVLGDCFFEISTKPYLNRCIPTQAVDLATNLASTTNITFGAGTSYDPQAGSAWFSDFLHDVYQMSGIVFGIGFGVSTAIAFIYLLILRIPGCLFISVWSILLAVQILLVIGAALLYSLSQQWATDNKSDDVTKHDHSDYQVVGAKILAIIVFVIAGLYFCLIIVLRSRVQLAIGVIQEACKALGNMKLLLFTPIFQVVGLIIFMVPWIIYVIYLASSGEMTVNTASAVINGIPQTYTYRTFEYTTNTKYAFLYMLFCYYWTSEFIVACGQMLIALSFSNWYFTRDKSTTGTGTVLWGLWATFRYHMGTSAFGSLIIAIIKTIRAVLTYFIAQAKKSHNLIAVYVMSVISCCLWCLEKCMKFLNKNAYIQTAIYGYSFCKSCRRAFFLLIRNILRVSAVNVMATFILLLGKLFIVASTVFIAYLAIAYSTSSNDVTGIISPLIFVAVLAYGVASVFSEIFGMGIETILLCFIADEEMFPPENRFAEGSLKQTIQVTAEKAAALAAAKKGKGGEIKVAPANNDQAQQQQAVAVVDKPGDGIVL